jgi:3-isopropylmalate dehydrogenase
MTLANGFLGDPLRPLTGKVFGRSSPPRSTEQLGSGAMPTIVTLPGDGIGPEVLDASLRVLGQVAPDLDYTEHEFGGASIDAHGTALTDEVLAACRGADAVLLAAVGGPKWDTTDPDAPRPEQGLLGLRKGLGLFANLRPVRAAAGALRRQPAQARGDRAHRPARRARAHGRDLLRRQGPRERQGARPLRVLEAEIERIAHVAFRAARSRVTSVDKANVLETSRLWREVVRRVHSEDFPNVELEHVLVDNAAMQLVASPRHFDVILTENMFGDILSDEAAMLTGSIGMLPSASLGDPDTPGVFEPVHGSAPDIAGQGIANPLAMILSAAMMLRHGLAREDARLP